MSGLIHSHRPADPLVAADQTWSSAGRLVTDVALGHEARWRWQVAFGVAIALMGVLAGSVGWLLWQGVGIWTGLLVGLFVVSALLITRWSRRARLGLLPA